MVDIAAIFDSLFRIDTFLFMNLGVVVGIIFGSIPGLTVMLAIVLFLPLTFGLDSITGIIMLLGIYCGGTYGGSISAILINTPGTPAAAATMLDGYPLSQNGAARKALMMALIASVIAGIISAIILLLAAPQVAKITMLFGPAEYFMLAVFGLSIIASVSSKNVLSGLIMGCIGIFISTIGLDSNSGVLRFSFGNFLLAGGIQLIPALIGLFAFSEVLKKANHHTVTAEGTSDPTPVQGGSDLKSDEIKKSMPTILRSSLIGTVVGAIPGTGGGIAAFLSYDQAKRKSNTPERYGKGELNGVAAAEAGNNGVTGSTLIPLLTLGIPGDGATAVFLGALMMHGLIPGPLLFTEHGTTVYALIFGLLLVNIVMLIQGRFLITYFARLSRIPESLLLPMLIVLCSAGAYALNSSTFDIYIALAFGIFAYYLIKFGHSPVPLLLGIILGPIAEQNLTRALTISDGSPMIFITQPISVFFIVLTFFSIFWPLLKSKKTKPLEDVNQG